MADLITAKLGTVTAKAASHTLTFVGAGYDADGDFVVYYSDLGIAANRKAFDDARLYHAIYGRFPWEVKSNG